MVKFKRFIFIIGLAVFFLSPCFSVFADTIYYNSGLSEKGLIVEEYHDRFLFSKEVGEKEVLKSEIKELFFDEYFQNNFYLGKRHEEKNDFDKALTFYEMSLKSRPDYKETQDAIKGLEDAKWRLNKKWEDHVLSGMVTDQLGVKLEKSGRQIVVTTSSEKLKQGDAVIRCWAKPLTHADLNTAFRYLVGLSNTMVKLVIERDIPVEFSAGFDFLALIKKPPLKISMELDGSVITHIQAEGPFSGSGLKEADIITKIDNHPTRYMELREIRNKIFYGDKKKIITVRREVMLMRQRAQKSNVVKNAMWVWHTKEILSDETKKRELLEFCIQKNVGALFFQLQYQLTPSTGGAVCKILRKKELISFIKEAHAQGVLVHALDGAATFCLEREHHLVLAQLKSILDYNKEVGKASGFDGVHYDNEPYLLAGFDSLIKNEIIQQYLSLNKKCVELIKSSGIKFDYGIDIPFWFDNLDGLHEKLIDICDNIGIMDYRNFASGPDGIIAHAVDELKYAVSAGKKVFIGLETSIYPPQKAYFVSTINKDRFDKLIEKKGLDGFAGQNRFEGFGLSTHAYNDKVYIGLVKPEGANDKHFDTALSKIRSLFGEIPRPADEETYNDLVFDTHHALSASSELQDIQVIEYSGKAGKVLMFEAEVAMLKKLTFEHLREEDLNEVMSQTSAELKAYPSFNGFAIHYYKTYRSLCEKKLEADPR